MRHSLVGGSKFLLKDVWGEGGENWKLPSFLLKVARPSEAKGGYEEKCCS